MLKTTAMLLEEYQNYHAPANKLSRMVARGELIPVVKGLYETDRSISGYLLAGSIYGPSYLSFEFALSRYGLIPEAVYTFTSATFEKKKKKKYENRFGVFTYQDVPSEVYPLDIRVQGEGEYTYQIASPEKALCDLLYAKPPVDNQKELVTMLIDDLRVDEERFAQLDKDKVTELADGYHCKNVRLLSQVMRRSMKWSL